MKISSLLLVPLLVSTACASTDLPGAEQVEVARQPAAKADLAASYPQFWRGPIPFSSVADHPVERTPETRAIYEARVEWYHRAKYGVMCHFLPDMYEFPVHPKWTPETWSAWVDAVDVGDNSPTQARCTMYSKALEEWSLRYGTLLSGWWMDGLYDHTAWDMKQACNWHTYAAAMKAGNPACAISFGGCKPVGSPYEDYSNGELLSFGTIPADGQWQIEDPVTKQLSLAKRSSFAGAWLGSQYRMQWLSYATVGETDDAKWGPWGNKGCVRDPKTMDAWMRKVFALGGVMILDGKVNRLGHIDPAQLKLYLNTPACHLQNPLNL